MKDVLQLYNVLLLSGIYNPCEFEPPHFCVYMITLKDTPQSVGLLWTSDQLVAETSTWQHTQRNRQTSMPPAGFEPAVPVGDHPQTDALDRSATGIGLYSVAYICVIIVFYFIHVKTQLHAHQNFSYILHLLGMTPSFAVSTFVIVYWLKVSWSVRLPIVTGSAYPSGRAV